MTPDQARRARELYAALRGLPRAARQARLAELCADDATVRREVEFLFIQADDVTSTPGGGEPATMRHERTIALTGGPASAPASAPVRRATAGAHYSAGAWGDFTLVEELGGGAFGVVFRAWDPALKRDVALKLIDVRRRGVRDADAVLREGQLMAKVRHEHVASIYSAAQIGDEVGLAMELVRGRTLSDVMAEQGPMSAAEAIPIGRDLADALAAIHRVGLLHRDVKASNAMREHGGRIVLMDFGAGLEVGEGRRPISGTPVYMAPEVITGEPATPASDVYSLGVLLFHLVTGDYPVVGGSFAEVRAAHVRGDRRALTEMRTDLPEAFLAIVERATAVRPGDRQASAAELWRELNVLAPAARVVLRPQPLLRRVAGWLGAAAGVAAAATVGCAAVGFVTTRVYAITLARPAEFASERPFDYVAFGVQALALPAVFVIVVLLVWNALRLVARLLRAVAPPVDRGLARVGLLASRLAGADPDVRAGLVAAVSLSGAAAVLWAFAPLFVALRNNINLSPLADLQVLGRDHLVMHNTYRLTTAALLLFVVLAAASLWRGAQRPGGRRPTAGPMASVAAGALVLLALNAAPWRVLYGTKEARQVTLSGERCLVVAESRTDALVTCPASPPPRNRTVPKAQLPPTTPTQWLFEAFRTAAADVTPSTPR
jgi:hypothetical protein